MEHRSTMGKIEWNIGKQRWNIDLNGGTYENKGGA